MGQAFLPLLHNIKTWLGPWSNRFCVDTFSLFFFFGISVKAKPYFSRLMKTERILFFLARNPPHFNQASLDVSRRKKFLVVGVAASQRKCLFSLCHAFSLPQRDTAKHKGTFSFPFESSKERDSMKNSWIGQCFSFLWAVVSLMRAFEWIGKTHWSRPAIL